MPHFISVRGPSVPEYLAHEIILRTQRWPLEMDDYDYVQDVYGVLGIPGLTEPPTWKVFTAAIRKLMNEYRSCRVRYISNSCLGSAERQGPGGWISWTGKVGCEMRQLPPTKKLSLSVLSTEWKVVADTFPALQLEAQLYYVRKDGTGRELQCVWTVSEGNAERSTPTQPWPTEEPLKDMMERQQLAHTTLGAQYQKGSSIPQLRLAVQNTRYALKLPPL